MGRVRRRAAAGAAPGGGGQLQQHIHVHTRAGQGGRSTRRVNSWPAVRRSMTQDVPHNPGGRGLTNATGCGTTAHALQYRQRCGNYKVVAVEEKCFQATAPTDRAPTTHVHHWCCMHKQPCTHKTMQGSRPRRHSHCKPLLHYTLLQEAQQHAANQQPSYDHHATSNRHGYTHPGHCCSDLSRQTKHNTQHTTCCAACAASVVGACGRSEGAGWGCRG